LQVLSLQDFFGEEDIFIAYGHEKLSADDFEIDPDGQLRFDLICCAAWRISDITDVAIAEMLSRSQ